MIVLCMYICTYIIIQKLSIEMLCKSYGRYHKVILVILITSIMKAYAITQTKIICIVYIWFYVTIEIKTDIFGAKDIVLFMSDFSNVSVTSS